MWMKNDFKNFFFNEMCKFLKNIGYQNSFIDWQHIWDLCHRDLGLCCKNYKNHPLSPVNFHRYQIDSYKILIDFIMDSNSHIEKWPKLSGGGCSQ